MLFNTNLEEIIFHRHQTILCDELIILSGYLGPNPVDRLKNLPLHSTVIYGMYGDRGIQQRLHNALINTQINVPHINIYYSTVPIHSKCYIWKNQNIIQHALIGSANFSTNGLTTPYREVLAETTYDTFQPLHEYIDRVMENSILCTDIEDVRDGTNIIQTPTIQISTQFCRMSLLDRSNNIHDRSGLNWMFSTGHVAPNDAYIAIKKDYIRQYPNLFPPKQNFTTMASGIGRPHRHNDKIDILWDDGFIMDGLLEGSQDEYGVKYPKQISSFPKKNIMGKYIRKRLGIPLGTFITKKHLENYGRTNIDVSLLDDGIYYFDFSV
ncbi:MAG: NgoFVII family restriction endonuclease [Sulfurovaceae bacterium]|nr:NgoFVII family restriction endonuclease [Sulfurovaceae bacterium]